MRVRALGTFEVEAVSARDLGGRKGRTLLKVLTVASGRPVSVDRIADVRWGDDQPSRPAEQVGVLVSRLRAVLGAERLTRSDAGYALATDWLDVTELRELLAVASEARAEGRLGRPGRRQTRPSVWRGVTCYRTRTASGSRPSAPPSAPRSPRSIGSPSMRRWQPATTGRPQRWPSRPWRATPTTRSSCGT